MHNLCCHHTWAVWKLALQPSSLSQVTSLVLNRSVTNIERVDTEVVLGTWGSRWTAGWRDLPEDPGVASSDQLSYATYYTCMAECVSQPPAK